MTAIKIWANDTNAAGGLLGHKIQIIAYDDASDTSKVPALIQKLISVDNAVRRIVALFMRCSAWGARTAPTRSPHRCIGW